MLWSRWQLIQSSSRCWRLHHLCHYSEFGGLRVKRTARNIREQLGHFQAVLIKLSLDRIRAEVLKPVVDRSDTVSLAPLKRLSTSFS